MLIHKLAARVLCFTSLTLAPAAAGNLQQLGSSTASVETLLPAGRTGVGFLELSMAGSPVIGSPFYVLAEGAEADAGGLAIVGTAEAPIFFPGFGATLFTGGLLNLAFFTFDEEGVSPRLLELPSVPISLGGLTLVTQVFAVDSFAVGGIAFSNGLTVVAGEAADALPFTLPRIPTATVDDPGQLFLDLIPADINGDGNTDYVASSFPSDSADDPLVSVFLSDGAGSFFTGPETAVAVLSRNMELASGDLNGDGFEDVVVGASNFFYVLLADGAGGLLNPVSTSVGTFLIFSIHVADLDRDGFQDVMIAVSVPQGVAILVYPGAGDGTLGLPLSSSIGGALLDIELVDVNGDNIPDAVLGRNASPSNLTVHLGRGNGTFAPEIETPIGFPAQVMRAGDFDQDGLNDIFFCDPDSMAVALGKGNGTFDVVSLTPALATDGSSPWVLAANDVNGDGIDDLVYTFYGFSPGGELGVFLGATDRNFSSGPLSKALHAGQGVGLYLEDLNADGVSDLVMFALRALTTSLGLGDGQFESNLVVDSSTDHGFLGVADMDGDQLVDLVAWNETTSMLDVFQSDGAGSFPLAESFALGIGSVQEHLLADINRDGINDVILLQKSPAKKLNVFLGPDFSQSVSFTTSGIPGSIHAGDLNGDGLLDLTVGNLFASDLDSFLGDGAGGFVMQTPFVGAGVNSHDLGDINLDGILDVMGTELFVATLEGLGDGSFDARTIYPVFASHVNAADIDLDGSPDMALGNTVVTSALVFWSNGNGTFGQKTFFDTGLFPGEVLVCDVNADLVPDVVAVNGGSVDFSVHYGLGGRAFSNGVTFGLGRLTRQLLLEDLDGDQLPEFIGGQGELVIQTNRLLDKTNQ